MCARQCASCDRECAVDAVRAAVCADHVAIGAPGRRRDHRPALGRGCRTPPDRPRGHTPPVCDVRRIWPPGRSVEDMVPPAGSCGNYDASSRAYAAAALPSLSRTGIRQTHKHRGVRLADPCASDAVSWSREPPPPQISVLRPQDDGSAVVGVRGNVVRIDAVTTPGTGPDEQRTSRAIHHDERVRDQPR